jgi:hypothetical protein
LCFSRRRAVVHPRRKTQKRAMLRRMLAGRKVDVSLKVYR